MEEQNKILKATQVLGNLLSKIRSEENKEKVALILKKYSDVQTRVEKIKELDNQIEQNKIKSKKIEIQSDKPIVAKRKKQNIATPQEEVHIGFFEFFFGSRKEINNFASTTGVITTKRLGTQFELSRVTIQEFKKFDIKQTASIEKKLNQTLVDAWKFLDITNYNLLVQLNSLIDGYLKIVLNLNKNNSEIENILNIGIDFYRSYLMIKENPNYIKTISKIVSENFSNKKSNRNIENLDKFIIHIFSKKNKEINFDNIITGIFGAVHKKILDFSKIKELLQVTKIDDSEYDVPPSIKQKIDVYTNSNKDKLLKIDSVLKRINFIQENLLSRSQENKYVFPIIKEVLIKVYQKLGIFDKKLQEEIQDTYKNPLKLLKNITYYLIFELYPILDSPVKLLKTNKEYEIFTKNVFTIILGQMKRTQNEINNFLEKHKNLEYSFKDYYDTSEKIDPVDKKSLKLTSTMISLYSKMGQSLIQILINHTNAEELEYSEKLELKKKYNQPISSLEIENRFIPFYSERIVKDNSFLDGLSPYEVILELGKILLNISLLFKDTNLIKLLKSKQEYENQKRTILKPKDN